MGTVMHVLYETARIAHSVVFLVIACQLLARAKDRRVLGLVRFFDAAVAAVLVNNIYSSIDLALQHVPAGERNLSGLATALLLLAAANGELCLKLWFRYHDRRAERRILRQQPDKETP